MTDLNGDERRKKNEFLYLGFGGFKMSCFQSTNTQKEITKISGTGPWVNMINWCKGHWCGIDAYINTVVIR